MANEWYQNPIPNYPIGKVFGDKPTYKTNATIVNDFLYVRDGNGNIIEGRSVDIGDKITVLDISYSKQLALIQYPTSKGYVQAYVSNATNTIKYDNEYTWKNGSTYEPVMDDARNPLGSLDPHESATLLYEASAGINSVQYCVVYDTDKGKHTKSGFVDFKGLETVAGTVKAGELVGDKPTYPTNAVVVNDFFYLRDEKGDLIEGRQVDIGDRITVLDVGYTKQLVLVQYPTSQGYRQGYIKNVPEMIKYDNQYKWCNGSTVEPVLFEDGREGLGSINPYERATVLYKHKGNGMYHVVYGTNKGANTKSGYVRYEGTSVPPTESLPTVNESNVTKIVYGTSGLGKPLEVYKIGNGNKILFAGFGIHGFEDEWSRDGIGLAYIANELIKALAVEERNGRLKDWSVYVSQSMNPDGLMDGWTNNGPGRCTVTTSVDMNRCFPTKFVSDYTSRNFTGSTPLIAPEAKALKSYLESLKAKNPSRMIVLDCHGWLNMTYGDANVASYFSKEFGFSHSSSWGTGYIATWAKQLCGEALLVEYPLTKSLNDVYSKGLHTKTINAIKAIVKNGSSSESVTPPVTPPVKEVTIDEVLDDKTFLDEINKKDIFKALGLNFDLIKRKGDTSTLKRTGLKNISLSPFIEAYAEIGASSQFGEGQAASFNLNNKTVSNKYKDTLGDAEITTGFSDGDISKILLKVSYSIPIGENMKVKAEVDNLINLKITIEWKDSGKLDLAVPTKVTGYYRIVLTIYNVWDRGEPQDSAAVGNIVFAQDCNTSAAGLIMAGIALFTVIAIPYCVIGGAASAATSSAVIIPINTIGKKAIEIALKPAA